MSSVKSKGWVYTWRWKFVLLKPEQSTANEIYMYIRLILVKIHKKCNSILTIFGCKDEILKNLSFLGEIVYIAPKKLS